MAAFLALLGLQPAPLSHGPRSKTQPPLAIVVSGGLLTAALLSVLISLAVCEWACSSKQVRERPE